MKNTVVNAFTYFTLCLCVNTIHSNCNLLINRLLFGLYVSLYKTEGHWSEWKRMRMCFSSMQSGYMYIK